MKEELLVCYEPKEKNTNKVRAMELHQYDAFMVTKDMFKYNNGLDEEIVSNMIKNKEVIYCIPNDKCQLVITGNHNNEITILRIYKEGIYEDRHFYTCLACKVNKDQIINIEEQNYWIKEYEEGMSRFLKG